MPEMTIPTTNPDVGAETDVLPPDTARPFGPTDSNVGSCRGFVPGDNG